MFQPGPPQPSIPCVFGQTCRVMSHASTGRTNTPKRSSGYRIWLSTTSITRSSSGWALFPWTLTATPCAATISTMGGGSACGYKGVLMAGADLRTQFEKISDSAKTANDKVKAAGKKTTDQLDADLASAR